MSGRKQHYIPQSFLRGFKIHEGGSTDKVWVFTENKEPYCSAIKKVAAQRDFYSKPLTGNTATLDDQITVYENDFAKNLSYLRSISVGHNADPTTAAEVVTHLIIRNAHIRNVMYASCNSMIKEVSGLLSNKDKIRSLVGLDVNAPTELFQESVSEGIKKNPSLAQLSIPEHVIQRIMFTLAEENFDQVIEQSSLMNDVLDRIMLSETKHVARSGHNQALNTSLSPEERIKRLRAFSWIVIEPPEKSVILPDCVAMGVDSKGEIKPLIFVGNEISSILFPITTNKILIGRKDEDSFPDLTSFNVAAASCSHNFFVSSIKTPELENIAKQIGKQSSKTINDAISNALNDLTPALSNSVDDISSTLDEAEPDTSPTVPGDRLSTSSDDNEVSAIKNLNYSIQFIDCADDDTAHQISAVVNKVVSVLNRNFSLDRLDGITFASDYHAALLNLDRGFPTSNPLTSLDRDYCIGVAMAPLVLRDDIVKSRIIIRGNFAHAIISDDEEERLLAIDTLIYALAQVAWVSLFDKALPNILLNPIEDPYESFLYPQVCNIWSSYFAMRVSADPNLKRGEDYQNILAAEINRAKKTILLARSAYQDDHDLDKLVNVALNTAGDILHHAAHMLGAYDGVSQSPFYQTEELATALDDLNLRAWLNTYQDDLRAIYSRCGTWTSFSEFLFFNKHVERLLWSFRIFPSKMPDGKIRVDVL